MGVWAAGSEAVVVAFLLSLSFTGGGRAELARVGFASYKEMPTSNKFIRVRWECT
jgi:hypothetical protein